jgi:hypothetical protein
VAVSKAPATIWASLAVRVGTTTVRVLATVMATVPGSAPGEITIVSPDRSLIVVTDAPPPLRSTGPDPMGRIEAEYERQTLPAEDR